MRIYSSAAGVCLCAMSLALWGCDAETASHGPQATPHQTAEQHIELETLDELSDAIDLFLRASQEQLLFATDTGERGGTLVYPGFIDVLSEQEAWDLLFTIADESFEAERDRAYGAGQGPSPGAPLPARPQRIQDGELGGLDSSSCRSCHFNGGPDGAGTASQVGLFRGDGQTLSSATLRDSPHVMGLGYINLLAREIETELQSDLAFWIGFAEFEADPFEATLEAKGIDFGTVTIDPDGTVDFSEVTAITEDLVVRPFGFKGRHADLVELSDEAFQLHHGMQSQARIEAYADDRETFLGAGDDPFDPDGDGVQSEMSHAQAVLMAAYLSMLGTPTIQAPSDPQMAFVWGRGRRVFEEVGCASCHIPSLRLNSAVTTLRGTGDTDLSVTFDLKEVGQDPVPHNIDFTPDEDDTIPFGTPIFAFTDFRRHDLGPEMAEPTGERLPDGSGHVIPGHMWMTRQLWGLADTAPYLHDGRAPTVHDAILWHGGDSADSRAAYLDASPEDQAALRVFLMSLSREPVILVE